MNNRIASLGARSALTLCVALSVLVSVQGQGLRHPQPGEVFRDTRVFNPGNTWRVTDPNAGSRESLAHYPNTVYGVPVDDLEGAVRAELIIDYWGGHIGTDERHIRFNNNEWIELPDLETGTLRPNCYLQALNFVLDIPLSHLVEGVNNLEGMSGGQICYGFNWGMWGMYGVVLRVYYDPETKPHPTGGISSPQSGDSIQDGPLITANAASNVGVAAVDFFAHFNGYDPDGDGKFRDWHVGYAYGARMVEHIGTDTLAPFVRGWNTELVPDQPPGGVKLIAHIRDNDGYTYVTEEVRDLTLERNGSSVRLYRSSGIPESFWVRNHEEQSVYFTIPREDDLSKIEYAFVLIRSWNAYHPETTTKINDFTVPLYGKDHRYDFNKIGLGKGEFLRNGLNTFTISSIEEKEHGTEILWPGPLLVVRYNNTKQRDSTSFPGLYSFDEESGHQVFDLTVNSNDGGIFGTAKRTSNGRYGGAIEFDGEFGHVDLGVLEFPGNELTVSLWAYVDSTSAPDGRLFAKAFGTKATEGQVVISLNNTTGIRYRLSTTNGFNDVVSHDVLTLDAWNHVAVTYDGTLMRTYVNGVQARISAMTGDIDNSSNVPVWIGDNPGGVRRSFKGRIDELRIYSIAQSPAQIAADMETAVVDSDLTAPTIPSNLVALLDSNTSASLTWEPSTDESGVEGYRVFRDGLQIAFTSATAYKDDLLFPNRTYAYTISAVDIRGNQSAASNISSVTTPPDLQPPTTPQNLTATSSAFSVSLNWSNSLDDTGIAFYRVFRNGVEVGTPSTAFYNDTGLDVESTYHYQVIAVDFIGNFSGLSKGVIATTLSEPSNPDLLLGLPFEEQSGEYARDSSGYRFDGLLTGGVNRVENGKIGRALVFSGGSGHVDIGHLNIPGSQMTIAAWIKADDFDTRDARIISKATGASDNQHYWMLSTINGEDGMKLRARLKTDSGSTSTLIGETTLEAGKWIHVAMTYDGLFFRIYVNGELDASMAKGGAIAQNSSVPAAIGDQPQGGRNFDGLIDEVRIHTLVMSSAELKQLMGMRLPGPGGSNIAPSITPIDDEVIFGDTSTGSIKFNIEDVGTLAEQLEVSALTDNAELVPPSSIALGGTGSTRTITVTPVEGLTGSAVITVVVDDGEAKAYESFNLMVVTPGNTAPTLSSFSDRQLIVGSSMDPIGFTVGDGETAAGSLIVSVESDNSDLVPEEGLSLSGSGAERALAITPAPQQTGTAKISVSVSDGEFFVSKSFVLLVSPPFGDNLFLGMPFEEEFGGTAFDVSENRNNGGLTAGVNRSEEGKLGRALDFSGAGGSVNLGTLDIPGSEVTIAAWILPADFDIPDARIISKATGLTSNQHFWMLSTVEEDDAIRIRWRLKAGARDTRTLVGGTDIPVGVWTHVAATYDGSDMRIFVNGQLDGVLAAGGEIAQNETVPVAIGNQPQGDRSFSGLIDEVHIYTQALVGPEIESIMVEALDPPNAIPVISSVNDLSVFRDSIVEDLAFTISDAETAPFLLDLSATSSNETLIPTSGISFGGVGSNRTMTITPATGKTGHSTVTIQVGDGEHVATESFNLTVITPGNTAPFVSSVDDLEIILGGTTGPIPLLVGDALTNASDLVLTAESDNPELVPSSAITLGGSGANRTIDIAPQAGKTGSATITVTVDDGEFLVQESFTVTVVTAVHPDLWVGLFFEDTGNAAIDSSLYGNNGLLTAGVLRSESAERGGAVVFSGSGGHVSLGNLDIPGSQLTISAWIRPDDFGIQDGRIISKATGLTDNQHYWMLSTIKGEGGTKLRMRLQNAEGDYSTLVGDANIQQGQWNHVAGTYDGSTMRIYVNGQLDASQPWSGEIATNPNVPVAIGDQPQGGRNFDGLIDEVQIYTRSLDGAEVQTIMEGSLEVPNSPPTISSIADRNALVGTVSDPIAFTVSDSKTSPFLLDLSVTSNDHALLPPSGIALGGSGKNRTITLTPAEGITGSALITLALSDGEFTVEESFNINVVTPGNAPPSVSVIDDLDIIPDVDTGPITFTVGDTETDPSELAVSATSDNLDLVPLSGIVFGGSGASRTVTITPAAGQIGEAKITIIASDGELTYEEPFTLSVVPPIHPDLILGMDFEEESGEEVYDYSFHANHGTITSGVGRSPLGHSGSALVFSGTGGRVDLGSIDVPGSQLTLSVWFRADDFGVQDARLISKASGKTDNEHYWMLSTVNDGGAVKARMRLKTTGGDTATVVGSTPLQAGVWTHVAGTYDGSSIRLYVNGQLDGSLPWQGDVVQDSSVPVAIGDQPQGGHNFDGRIDDVQVYARSFTQPDIQAIRSGTLDVPNTGPSVSEVQDQYVFMDETAGPIGFTIGDTESTGYLLNVSVASDNQAVVPNNRITMSGDGAKRRLTISPAVGVTGAAKITITVDDGEFSAQESFVLRVVTPGNTAPRIGSIDDQIINFGSSTETLAFTVADSQTSTTNLIVTADSDNHIIAPPSGIVIGGSGFNRTVTVTPGSIQSGEAQISVTVSDGELFAVETFQLTVNPPFDSSLLLGFPFEEESGNTAYDISTNVNDGTISSGVSRSLFGQYGRALEFSGSGGHVDLHNLDIPGSEMTIAAWIKADDFGIQDSRIVSKAKGSLVNDHYWMLSSVSVNGQSKLRMRLKTANGFTSSLVGATTLPAAEWTHVAVTYDGSNLRLYVNGQQDGSLALSGDIAQNAGVPVVIGDQPQGGRNFDGLIDDFRIYTQALSGQNVQAIMNEALVDVGAINIPPAISQIQAQSIFADHKTAAIPFSIDDLETNPSELAVSATSTNQTLIPSSGIALGGEGSERWIQVTPAPGRSGSAVIKVSVNDGSSIVTESFTVTVKEPLGGAGWWNPSWEYRTLVEVGADGAARRDGTVDFPINFTSLLDALQSDAEVDATTLRVVEVDAGGHFLDDEVPFQFDPDVEYDTATNAAGNLVIKLTGSTPADATRYYQVYFTPSGTGASALWVPSEMTVTDDVLDEGQLSYRISTPTGTLYYHKQGAGFSSWLDIQGNDWIDYHPTGGAVGNYRGIPNMVHPEGHFHPGAETATSSLVADGPLKATIRSITNDGKWECIWEIYGRYARMTLLKADHEYWFLYEGTPGGTLDENTDLVIQSDGDTFLASDEWVYDLVGEEWVTIADPDVGRSIFVASHQDDGYVDTYTNLDGVMTVLAFGREGLKAKPYLAGLPAKFTVGLVDQVSYSSAAVGVRSAIRDYQLTVGQTQHQSDSNNGPHVAITGPADGSVFKEGDSIALLGEADDVEDGTLDSSLAWTSDIDGTIPGSGPSLVASGLSVGTHRITASATDSGGLVGSKTINVTIDPNIAPTVTITAPATGRFFGEGEIINLVANAIDPEDGNITSGITWKSDKDGAIPGTGGSAYASNLSVGVHTITATSVDSGSLAGSASIVLTISDASEPPVVTITAPADGAGFNQGTSIEFAATAIDPEDGDITSKINWHSSIDGAIAGSGGSISVSNLSVGIHTIKASAVDSGFLPGSASTKVTVRIPSQAPAVTITSPSSDSLYAEGIPINLKATATDPEDGDVTPSIKWSSNIDGELSGQGGSILTSTLSVGIHTLTATASDAGLMTGSSSTTVVVSEITTPAEVVITGPGDGAVFHQGDNITFTASATDAEDGDITDSITWRSNIDGSISGSGGSVSTSSLSLGTHTITATAVDSGLLPGAASIVISVSIDSAVPSVTILEPNDNAFFNEGQKINLVAAASDIEDGDLTPAIVWRSNIDGQLTGQGGALSTSKLSVGVHTITALAADSGFLPGSDSITLTVRRISSAPVVSISAPAEGAFAYEGDTINFTASAIDIEDGNISSGLTWRSDIDGPISGSGASVSVSSLSIGQHVISATAIDSGLLSGSDTVTVTVRSFSQSPTASITSPSEGAFFTQGDPISLKATASDPEDGDISSSVIWRSDRDGPIEGTGGSVITSSLSVGVHTITAIAVDSGYMPASDSVSIAISALSNAPVTTITEPESGSIFYVGDTITFTGTAGDADDGDITDSISWESDIDGPIAGQGGSVSTSSLSVGVHTITATAIDSGFQPGEDTTMVTVRGASQPPVVTITGPSDAASFTQGALIEFAAAAIDPEDGDVSSSIVWTSDIDGRISGSGGEISTPALSVGVHTITATAVDSGLVPGSSSLTLTVMPLVGQFVSDDFGEAELDTDVWEIVDPVGDGIVSTNGGALVIELPGGVDHDVWTQGNLSTRVMQDVNDTDFELEVKFDSPMPRQYHMQGFIVEQDANNFLRFDFVRFPSTVKAFSASFVGTTPTTQIDLNVPFGDRYYIRVNRTGDWWNMKYSLDGDNWKEAGTYFYPLKVDKVGIYAGNASGPSSPPVTVVADYVFNTMVPVYRQDAEVNVIVSGEGTVTADPDQHYYPAGEQVKLTAKAAKDWIFDGWAGDIVSNDNPLNVTLDGDLEVYALFLPTDDRPVIDVWYGDHQTFGTWGVPQSQINILGNVIIAAQIESLTYSLNGSYQGELSMGPESGNIRLARTGDFNIEIPFTDLNEGENLVSIRAVGFDGTVYTRDVTVDSTIYNVWPRPYAIDWSQVSRIDEVGQVVDGKWEIVAGGVKAVESHYDRLIAIGDIEWTDYEVTVPITVHAVDHQPPPNEPLVGIMLRWDGHEKVFFGEQPGTEWRPIGAMGVHGWYTEGPRGGAHFQIFETGSIKFAGYPGKSLPLETTYYFKFRVETVPDQDFGLYSYKVWPAGQLEPSAWGITRQAQTGMPAGSLLLVAHYVEATFGNILVTSLEGNTPPSISITGPTETGNLIHGSPIRFTATALDPEDGDITNDISWSSNIDGPIPAKGGSISTSMLSEGEHVIKAAVVDADSSPNIDTITINILPNTKPTVKITGPTNGFTELSGVPITFTGTANDFDDGNVTDSITWVSSIDGPLPGKGGSISARLYTVGTHVITATARDEGSLAATAQINVNVNANPNTAPVVQIASPSNGFEIGEGNSITFTASASDAQDGNVTGSLVWSSNLDGVLDGSGGSISTSSLSVGTHKIKASVTDSGQFIGSSTINVTIKPNLAPVITIAQPLDGAVYTLGDTVSFSGSARDAEDGNVTDTLIWSSNIDGTLAGSGASLSTANLSPGNHVITATASDSRGLSASSSMHITVHTPRGPFVSDDFSFGSIDTNEWSFVNPVGDGSYSVGGGVLSISVPANADHDVWTEGNRTARLLQRIDNTDFGVQVKFGSTPSKRYQLQGLLVEQDEDNFIRFDVISTGSSVAVFAANFRNSDPTVLFNRPISISSAYYLQVQRVGDQISLLYSIDGVTWVTGATITRAMDVVQVGVYAGNASGDASPAFTAIVDYMFNTASPISPEDQGGPNAPPQVYIAAPLEGSVYLQNQLIDFAAVGEDPEDGDVDDSIVWSSDRDGPFALTNGSIVASDLSPGAHVLTATATDAGGLSGSASTTIEISENTAPIISITGPAQGATFLQGTSITFTGTANDVEDGILTGSLKWSSSIDGEIPGTGGSVTTSSLSMGHHVISASVADSSGQIISKTMGLTVYVQSGTPVVNITGPADSSTYIETDRIDLSATASDAEDGDLTELITWSSDLDGEIPGTGGAISTASLSVGTHVITATARDAGFISGSDSITVVVNANTAPVITVTEPDPGSIFTLGDVIGFTATATDLEDGNLTASLTWSSNIDGPLPGSGGSISTSALSAGDHIITATTTDSYRLSSSDSIAVTVHTPAGPLRSDDFSGTELNKNEWLFVNPMGDASYSVGDGVLSISVPAGTDHDVWTNGNRAARAMQRIDDVEFSVAAKFGSTPSKQFQSQGLIIEEDSSNFIRYDVYSNGTSLYVFGASFVNGAPTMLFNKSIGTSPSYFLQVTREFGQMRMNYSLDGTNWSRAGVLNRAMEVSQVGVFAGNASGAKSPAYTAVVDYLFNTDFPISPEDVGGPNTVPLVSIVSPVNGTVFSQGEAITFSALADDAEDGDLTTSLRWRSNLSGPLDGTGGVISTSDLSVGTHVISAAVSDSASREGSASISVTIQE